MPRFRAGGRAGAAGARRRVLCGLALVLAAAAPVRGAMPPAPLPRLGPARNFVLTTQQNDRLWLTQLRDRVVVLTFFCTTCEACPGLLPALLELSRTLGDAAGRRVFFVAVSVDPRRDTAPVLRRFARAQGADLTAWAFLTGKPAEVEVVSRWYGAGVPREDAQMAHTCVTVLIDGSGVIRGRYGRDEIDRVRGGIEALFAEAGR